MEDETTHLARVEYLNHLTAEFHRYFPNGTVRSSEPGERRTYNELKRKIAALTTRIEEDLL